MVLFHGRLIAHRACCVGHVIPEAESVNMPVDPQASSVARHGKHTADPLKCSMRNGDSGASVIAHGKCGSNSEQLEQHVHKLRVKRPHVGVTNRAENSSRRTTL